MSQKNQRPSSSNKNTSILHILQIYLISNPPSLVLGNFMVAAGVALIIIVTQRALLKNQELSTAPDMQVQIQELRKEIQQLKEMLNNQI